MNYSEALERQLEMFRKVEARVRQGHRLSDHARLLPRAITRADTYFVSRDMADFLSIAAAGVPAMTLLEELLPTREGFVWLEKPTLLGKQQNQDVYLRGVLWQPGVVASDQTYVDRLPGTIITALTSSCLCCGPLPNSYSAWRFGLDTDEALRRLELGATANGEFDIAMMRATLSRFAAFCILVNQRILTSDQRRAERHARKRLAAAGYEHKPLIRVVELRRKQSSGGQATEHEKVDWNYQWMVSGHWHRYWMTASDGSKVLQPKWLMPYVKGPDNKPLKPPRAKVFAVVR